MPSLSKERQDQDPSSDSDFELEKAYSEPTSVAKTRV
ncbi:hypothetical protein AA0120_g12653 [Alternaria tenuissima]|nr:hypothetical protein AA0120_g12653 [Alternaria tenuissima]